MSLATAGAGLAVAFLAPWVGARTDHQGNRISVLAVTTGVAVLGTCLLAIGPTLLTLVVFGISLVGFHVGSAVYDALLLDVSTPRTRSRVSGLGVAIGYVGSFIGLGIGSVVLDVGLRHRFPLLGRFAGSPFPFSDTPRPRGCDGVPQLWRISLRSLRSGRPPGLSLLTRFLVGRFCYTETVNTLIGGFLAIYATEEAGLSTSQVTVLLGAAIAASMAGGFFGGWLASRLGPGPAVRMILKLWIVTIALGVTAGISGLTVLIWIAGLSGGVALAPWARPGC